MTWLAALWLVVLAGGITAVARRCVDNPRALATFALVATVALLLRSVPGGFYGLEYEDAYVYAAAARFASVNSEDSTSGGLTVTVCAVGSLAACEETETYPGHLSGYPAFLTMATAFVGNPPAVYPMLGAALGVFAALCVWWACLVLTGSTISATGAALLFATTPALALYGGSAVSETASSAALAVWCGACAEALASRRRGSQTAWAVVALSAALLAALTRREDLICLPLTAICFSYVLWWRLASVGRVTLIGVSAAVVLPLVWIVAGSLRSEIGEYGEFSFSLGRLLSETPTIARALASPQYFGALLWVALAGGGIAAASAWRPARRPLDIWMLCLVAVMGVWLLSYGAHVRSTYQLAGVEVTPFDFLRYLSNTGVLLSVLSAVGIAKMAEKAPRRTVLALALLAVVGGIGAAKLRQELTWAEWRVRTEPARAAIEAAAAIGARVPIVTLEPLVAQLQASPLTVIVGLPSLNTALSAQLGDTWVYLEKDIYLNDVDRKRYAAGFAALGRPDRVLRQGDGWRVWLMTGRS